MPETNQHEAGSGCPTPLCSLSDTELLRELLSCFYWNGEGLEWSYIEGTHIGSVLTPEIDARLQEIKQNATGMAAGADGPRMPAEEQP